MIKVACIFVASFFIAFTGFAQDTVRIETVRVDTVKVETVRVDTVLVMPVNTSPAVQNTPAKTAPQHEQKPLLNPGKMYFGGYVNLSFGSYTVIGIEPMVGYKLTPKFSIGTKLSYEYISDKSYNEDYSGSNYGLSFFSRYRITPRFYSHAEYSAMNYKLFYGIDDSDREWVSFLFLGGGLSQPISRNTWFTAEVLFDVLQNENSPYAAWAPFFSVGFGVGF
jgi:hypothetical protein